MRKFGCNILAVVQQYDIIKDSAVRDAMIGNSKMLLKLKCRPPLQQRLSSQLWPFPPVVLARVARGFDLDTA
jgi:hypothetical protein